MFRTVCLAIAAAALAGCISYTPETKAIRVVYKPAEVQACTQLGVVLHPSVTDAVMSNFVGSGKGYTDVLNQSAALHADTVLILNMQQVSGIAYRCNTHASSATSSSGST